MATEYLDVRRVAVIGAGVSGVSAAIYLKRAGLDVKGFERSSRSGGLWVFDERSPKEPAYPSTLPSVGDSPEYESYLNHKERQDTPVRDGSNELTRNTLSDEDLSLSFAPPGPCYVSLKNNVSTVEMEMTCQKWKPQTGKNVPHHVLAEYIEDAARDNNAYDVFSFHSRIDKVAKVDSQWRLDLSHLKTDDDGGAEISTSVEMFDAVVVASGHYHACRVPDIAGLDTWKKRFPRNVHHSKWYRQADQFRGQNILLIGSGVSSFDIARDLSGVARSVYQSSRGRGGQLDIPSYFLPDNAARIGALASFSDLESNELDASGAIPGIITLSSGERLCKIHHVIVCTGYHISYPFMRQYHADGVDSEDANDTVLVTDGEQTHNLHRDIWYIPDPTLAFVGVPYHVATFSLFEFQAMALAATFSGKVPLPVEAVRRAQYQARVQEKGSGRTFHSLLDLGEETSYVQDLVEMVERAGSAAKGMMTGHSQSFLEAYALRREMMQAVFSKVRDPVLDQQVLALLQCSGFVPPAA